MLSIRLLLESSSSTRPNTRWLRKLNDTNGATSGHSNRFTVTRVPALALFFRPWPEARVRLWLQHH